VKKIYYSVTLVLLTLSHICFGQSSSITANTTWSSTPACTNGCTYNISAGVTLNINAAFTCNNCTFNNGTININSKLTCQPCTFNGNTVNINSVQLFSNSGTTAINNATVVVNGTSSTVQGSIYTNTAFSISNSSLTFNNNTYFYNAGSGVTTMGAVATPTTLTFNGNAYYYSNSSTYIKSYSQFVLGDGTASSTAYFYSNGGTLNIYGTGSISLQNSKNYYYNWSAYNYYATNTASTYTSYPNSSAPKLFGCAALNNSGINTCTALPVSLSDFTAAPGSNNSVELSWTTAQESSFSHFAVQRSAKGETWESIATVQSKGYSSIHTDYQFTDASPLAGANYYRLQLVNVDGTFSYSKVVQITKASGNNGQISIFPNPIVNLTFNVKVPSTETTLVKVYTMDGRLLYSTSLTGQNQYQVKLPANASGSNFLAIQVISNGTTQAFNALNR